MRCPLGLLWSLPCCSSTELMDPERSRSYCWKRFFHCWRNFHRAEKPTTSMRPDLVLSNMSEWKEGKDRGRFQD